MYEFLKKLFKEVDGQPEAITAEELIKRIQADSKLKIVNLEDGGYVAKEKLDAKITELSGVKKQLDDANKEIQSYKDMDIEGVKKSAKEWEEKYNTDTQNLKDQLAQQERSHQTDRYLDTVGLRPGAMYREFVKKAFDAKEFKLDGEKFLGADDFIAELKKNPDYKDAFIQDNPDGGAGDQQNQGGLPAGTPAGAPGTIPATTLPGQATPQKPLPQFATGTSCAGSAGAPGAGGQNPFMNFHFTDVRPRGNSGGTNQ